MASKKSNDTTTIDPNLFDDTASDTATSGFAINFAEVPDNGLIPDGAYEAVIKVANVQTSKQGNPMIALRWSIDDESEHQGRIVFDNLVFTPTALWRVKEVLKAIGFPETFSGEVDPEDLLHTRAVIHVRTKAGSGTNPQTGEPYPPRNVVARVVSVGSAMGQTDFADLI